MDLWSSSSSSSIRSIFSPSVLFVLLNVVIGTIALISTRRSHRSSSHSHHRAPLNYGVTGGVGDVLDHHHQQQPPIARSSSSNVLERVRSLGGALFRFRSGDLPPIVITGEDDSSSSTTTTASNTIQDDNHHHHHQQQQQEVQFRRIHSESESKGGAKAKAALKQEEKLIVNPKNKKKMMKKSTSAMTTTEWRRRSEDDEKEEEEAVVRAPPQAPAMRLRRDPSVDQEVDAKADDFINRFRQQLKLQRLDSILRYKEMLTNPPKSI